MCKTDALEKSCKQVLVKNITVIFYCDIIGELRPCAQTAIYKDKLQ